MISEISGMEKLTLPLKQNYKSVRMLQMSLLQVLNRDEAVFNEGKVSKENAII